MSDKSKAGSDKSLGTAKSKSGGKPTTISMVRSDSDSKDQSDGSDEEVSRMTTQKPGVVKPNLEGKRPCIPVMQMKQPASPKAQEYGSKIELMDILDKYFNRENPRPSGPGLGDPVQTDDEEEKAALAKAVSLLNKMISECRHFRLETKPTTKMDSA